MSFWEQAKDRSWTDKTNLCFHQRFQMLTHLTSALILPYSILESVGAGLVTSVKDLIIY